jgi:hypothetical protein
MPGSLHFVTIGTISPQPPAAEDHLFVLPRDPSLQPAPAATLRRDPHLRVGYVFVFPRDCVLARARLRASVKTLRSYNTLGPGGECPHDVCLFEDGEAVGKLLTISAGASTCDVRAELKLPIRGGSEVEIVVPVARNASGSLMNFLLSFEIQ